MYYFHSFPKVLTTDYNNNGVILTNIMKRASFVPTAATNPLSFYKYDLQEGDTPDIVANKYYGDSYRYWIPLFSSNITDPQWDWPLDSKTFDTYIANKYFVAAGSPIDPNTGKPSIPLITTYTQGTVYHYTKTIDTVDSYSLKKTTNIIVIDETTYNSTETGVTIKTFSDNNVITQTVSVAIVSIYDYEIQKNESKRSINLINSIFTSAIESEFKSLMGT
jgi:hypothetical protein